MHFDFLGVFINRVIKNLFINNRGDVGLEAAII